MSSARSDVRAEAAELHRRIETARAKPLPARGLAPGRAEEMVRDLRRASET